MKFHFFLFVWLDLFFNTRNIKNTCKFVVDKQGLMSSIFLSFLIKILSQFYLQNITEMARCNQIVEREKGKLISLREKKVKNK